jgi:diadenylate cyclase
MSDVLWILSRLGLRDAIDILLVAGVFFALLHLIKGTQAVQLLRGVIILVFVAVLLSSVFRPVAFSWLIGNAIPALLIAIPVIFQPELRKALERLGRAGGLIDRPLREAAANRVISQVARACRLLAERRHGALIILERNTGLQDYVDTGVEVDAQVSAELLMTIFFPNTALHDGAVIIREDVIVAAAVVLPLSAESMLDRDLGTRHRAALGISEQTDAIAIVVSEQTGAISVAHNGRIVRHLDDSRLRNILQRLYGPYPGFDLPTWLQERMARRNGQHHGGDATVATAQVPSSMEIADGEREDGHGASSGRADLAAADHRGDTAGASAALTALRELDKIGADPLGAASARTDASVTISTDAPPEDV